MASTEFRSLLNQTFTLWRKGRMSDGAGGWLETLTQVATFQGRLSGGRPTQKLSGAKWPAHVEWTLFLEAGLDVRRHDIIEGAKKRLRVVGVREPSLMGHHLEIEVEEDQEGA